MTDMAVCGGEIAGGRGEGGGGVVGNAYSVQ